ERGAQHDARGTKLVSRTTLSGSSWPRSRCKRRSAATRPVATLSRATAAIGGAYSSVSGRSSHVATARSMPGRRPRVIMARRHPRAVVHQDSTRADAPGQIAIGHDERDLRTDESLERRLPALAHKGQDHAINTAIVQEVHVGHIT